MNRLVIFSGLTTLVATFCGWSQRTITAQFPLNSWQEGPTLELTAGDDVYYSGSFSASGSIGLTIRGRFEEVASTAIDSVRITELEVTQNNGLTFSYPSPGSSVEINNLEAHSIPGMSGHVELLERIDDHTLRFRQSNMMLRIEGDYAVTLPWRRKAWELNNLSDEFNAIPVDIEMTYDFDRSRNIHRADVVIDISDRFDFGPASRALGARITGSVLTGDFFDLSNIPAEELLQGRRATQITFQSNDSAPYAPQVSLDGGTTWDTVGAWQSGSGARTWTVPVANIEEAQLRLLRGDVIDFESFPGPDGLLGTSDDIAPSAPDNSGFIQTLGQEFADLGPQFSSASLYFGDEVEGKADNHYIRANFLSFDLVPSTSLLAATVQINPASGDLYLLKDDFSTVLTSFDYSGATGLSSYPFTFTSNQSPISYAQLSVNTTNDFILFDDLILSGTPLPITDSSVALSGGLVFEIYTETDKSYTAQRSSDTQNWTPIPGFEAFSGTGFIRLLFIDNAGDEATYVRVIVDP